MNLDSCVMCGSDDLDHLYAPMTARCRSCGATITAPPAARGFRSTRYAAMSAAAAFRGFSDAVRRSEKIDKIRRLRDRGATDGERAAAQEALDRMGAG